MASVELDPANLSEWDLRVHICWERWYAAGHGCQRCAEVLHS